MNVLPDGTLTFNDVYELTYEMFNELDLEVRPDGTVYDTRGIANLAFNGMMIKATVNPYQIHYAGEGEIACDILGNIRLVTMFMGFYIKRKQEEGMPFRSYYPNEIVGDDEIKRTNLTIKFDDVNEISTKYYHNKCLKFIEMIFLLNEETVDLSNFDVIEEVIK